MENNHSNEVSFIEKMMWHKPQVQKLTINVDTSQIGLSGPVDFATDG